MKLLQLIVHRLRKLHLKKRCSLFMARRLVIHLDCLHWDACQVDGNKNRIFLATTYTGKEIRVQSFSTLRVLVV